MDWERQRALFPHYVAVVLLVAVYVVSVRVAFGDVVPAVNILGVVVVVLGYPTVVRAIGLEPAAWDRR